MLKIMAVIMEVWAEQSWGVALYVNELRGLETELKNSQLFGAESTQSTKVY